MPKLKILHKTVIAGAIFFLTFTNVYAFKIDGFLFKGFGDTSTNTILHFFYEYRPDKEWNKQELSKALVRTGERLERTGWFRNISVTHIERENGENLVLFYLNERFPYSFWSGSIFAGVKRYNIWGKGKAISFEIGPYQQNVRIEDAMIAFSRFSFDIRLGAEEFTYYTMPDNLYLEHNVLRRFASFNAGYRVIPDGYVNLIGAFHKIEELTNQIKIDSYMKTGLRLKYDRIAGYPAINKGIRATLDLFYLFNVNALETTLTAEFFQQPHKKFALSQKLNAGYISEAVNEYQQFSLRNINGLRTLNHIDGLIGNVCWNADIEARWKFWEPIPFLVFDMEIEAIVFFAIGEARNNTQSLGNPNFVGGAGLRFYLQDFIIRAEVGLDNAGETTAMAWFGTSL